MHLCCVDAQADNSEVFGLLSITEMQAMESCFPQISHPVSMRMEGMSQCVSFLNLWGYGIGFVNILGVIE